MDEWALLGEIVMLTVQTDKVSGDPYRPAGIARVERIQITRDGVAGLVGGRWVPDRHHRRHPGAGRWAAGRAISVGFSGHYERMRAMFRDVPLGDAGENILVGRIGVVRPEELAGGVRIGRGTGAIELGPVVVAEPCVSFTRYMLDNHRLSADEVAADRERLRGGLRGFVMGAPLIDTSVDVTVGDPVFGRAA